MQYFYYAKLRITEMVVRRYKIVVQLKRAHCGLNIVANVINLDLHKCSTSEFNSKMAYSYERNKTAFGLEQAHSGTNTVISVPKSYATLPQKFNTMAQYNRSTKAVGLDKQAHCGSNTVASVLSKPVAQVGEVSRSGIGLGPIQLVWPKKEKIEWSVKRDYYISRFNTSTKYTQINKRQSYYNNQKYEDANRYTRQRHLASYNKQAPGIPGPKLPSNPLPPTVIKEKIVPVKQPFSLYDAMYGDDDDEDPEVQAEKEYKYKMADFLKPRAQGDEKLTLPPLVKKPKIIRTLEQVAEVIPSRVEAVAVEPRAPANSPTTPVAIPRPTLLQKAKALGVQPLLMPPQSVKNIVTTVSNGRLMSEVVESVSTLSLRDGIYDGLWLTVNGERNVGIGLNIEAHWSLSAIVAELAEYGYDFSHYIPLVRHNAITLMQFCRFADVFIGCRIGLQRPDQIEHGCTYDTGIPTVLLATCSEILSYYQQKRGAPLLVVLDELKPAAQGDERAPIHDSKLTPSEDVEFGFLMKGLRYRSIRPPPIGKPIYEAEYEELGAVRSVDYDAEQNFIFKSLTKWEWDLRREIARERIHGTVEPQVLHASLPRPTLTQAAADPQPTAQPEQQRGFLQTIFELPGAIHGAAHQVSQAAAAGTQMAQRANEAIARTNVRLGEINNAVHKIMKGAEALRLLLDAHVQYEYIISLATVPMYIRIGKSIDIIARFAALCVPQFDPEQFFMAFAGAELPSYEAAVRATPQVETNVGSNLSAAIFAAVFRPTQGTVSGTAYAYMQRFNVASTAFSRVSSAFSFQGLVEYFGTLLEYACVWMGTNSILTWYNDVSGRNIDKFVAEANTYLLTSEDSVGNDEALDAVLLSLDKRRQEIVGLIALHGWTREIARLRDITKRLEDRMQLHEMRKEDIDGRITPFCICVSGKSQIGKSQLLISLADLLLPEVPLGLRVYARGQTEFYDGYNGHQCMLVDDWAARADADFGELLDWVTCNKTPLKMASIDSAAVGKKGTLFKAKLVLLATNTSYPNLDATMLNSEAVLARRHLLVEATKVRDFDPNNAYSHLEFKLRHPVSCTEPAVGPFTYDELCNMIKLRYTAHMRTQKQLMDHRKARRLLTTPVAQVIANGPWRNTFITATQVGLGFSSACHGMASAAAWMTGEAALGLQWGAKSLLIGCLAVLIQRFKSTETKEQKLAKFLEANGFAPLQQKRIMGIVNMVSEAEEVSHIDKCLQILLSPDTTAFEATQTYLHARTEDRCVGVCKLIYDKFKLRELGVPPMTFDAEAYQVKNPKLVKPVLTPEAYQVKQPKIVKPAFVSEEQEVKRKPVVHEQESEPWYDDINYTVPEKPQELVVAEASSDKAALDIASNVVKPRMVRVTFDDFDSNTSLTLNGLMIKGTVALLPLHLFFNSNTGEPRNRGNMNAKFAGRTNTWHLPAVTITVPFKPENIKYKNSDWCLYDFENACQPYSNIAHLFVREKDLSFLSEFEAQLLVKNDDTFGAIETIAHPISFPVTYSQGPRDIRLLRGWEYQANTVSGDCGAPLIAYVPHLVGKLVGIHVCSVVASARGHSDLITSEMLTTALASC